MRGEDTQPAHRVRQLQRSFHRVGIMKTFGRLVQIRVNRGFDPEPTKPVMPGASGLTKTSTPSGVASSGHLFSTCILVGRPYSQLDLQPLPEPRFDPAVRDCQTDQPRNRKGGPGKRDGPAEVDSR